MKHEAVAVTSTVGSVMNDGWYGLCRCGYFDYVTAGPPARDVMENKLQKHITERAES